MSACRRCLQPARISSTAQKLLHSCPTDQCVPGVRWAQPRTRRAPAPSGGKTHRCLGGQVRARLLQQRRCQGRLGRGGGRGQRLQRDQLVVCGRRQARAAAAVHSWRRRRGSGSGGGVACGAAEGAWRRAQDERCVGRRLSGSTVQAREPHLRQTAGTAPAAAPGRAPARCWRQCAESRPGWLARGSTWCV